MDVFDKFLHGIRIVLIRNQILGTTTLSVHKKKFIKSKIRCILNIIAILLFLVFALLNLYHTAYHTKNASLYKTTDVILIIVISVYVTTVWLYGIINHDRFSQLLTLMIDFDRRLFHFGCTVNYDYQRKRDILQLIVRLSLIFLITSYFFVVRVHVCGDDPLFEIMRIAFLLIKSTMCHQTIQLVGVIRARFFILNKYLRRLVKNKDENGRKLMTLCKICDMHHHLIKINKLFNKTFGLLLLFMFGVSFVGTVICFFYMSASVQTAEIDWKYGSLALVFSVSFIADMIYVCDVCYKTVEEAKLVGELIHKIDTEDHDIIDEVEMFSLQICNAPIEFSAAQFFSIDHTLIFSIIGGVTTYIIILIQLSSTLLIE